MRRERPPTAVAIMKGTKRRQDDRIVASYRYFEVVYRRKDDLVFVITVQRRR